jgi:ornithine--oxo-acid transaminase
MPDGLMLGKALGGGLLPVSLFLARRELMQVFTPGDHGSTFGGNPIAAAVGLAALDTLVDERLAERAAVVGAHLLGRLSSINNPIIREVAVCSPGSSCIGTWQMPARWSGDWFRREC